jgi:predicted MPP superfamily phosphohydrolase
MRANLMILIPLVLSLLVIDLYTYRGLRPLLRRLKKTPLKRFLNLLFWGVTLATLIGFIAFNIGIKNTKQAETYVYVGYLSAGFILFYFPKLVFIIFVFLKDIQILFNRIKNILNQSGKKSDDRKSSSKKIKRSVFLYQLGAVIAAIPFVAIFYGITHGKSNFRIISKRISFSNLPKSFKGLKIIQISDIHLGSLNNDFDSIAEAVDIINTQNADLVLFTGDLVNNFSEETEGWQPVLSKIKAKIGKFSVMGNHDYGDYSRWESAEEKTTNLAAIKNFHAEIGFRLLLNETETIEINGEKIALIGVENWGQPPFPQYGNLTKASANADNLPFKILLSHDPSHWDAEVVNDTNIDLTLAGHTHGMQFGFEYFGLKWSPIQYKYKRWGGLYRENKQYLYVNRGLGYIGFPGRIGMPPEITLIELT